MTPGSPKRTQEQNDAHQKRRNAMLYAIFIQYLVFVLLVLGGYLYINSVDRRSDHDWCDLLNALTADSPPPASERAREIAKLLEDLKHNKGCEES